MPGHIISVIGGKGGVGKSQIAANLSFAYAAEIGKKILLVDFDQKSSGDQNFITGINTKKTVKDLSEFDGSIDPRTINQFVTPHPSDVMYLGMPNDPSISSGINVDNLGKFLKAAPNLFPLTIIDAGSDLNPLALKALEFSTAIMFVVTPDILAVHQTRRMFSELVTMMFPKEMMFFTVNQMVKGHPVTPEVIGKQIGRPVFSIIPKDDPSCVAALNKKKPAFVMNKGSAFSRGVSDCARKIIQKNILKSLEKLNKSPSTLKQAEKGNDDKRSVQVWTELKRKIHRGLVEEMDLKKTDDKDPKAKIILREKTKKLWLNC